MLRELVQYIKSILSSGEKELTEKNILYSLLLRDLATRFTS